MFINFTNHPSDLWSDSQLEAARAIGGNVLDIPFPRIGPRDSMEDIAALASRLAADIISLSPKAVLCQGEMTLCYSLIYRLQQNGISVYAARSHRRAEVRPDGRGNTLRSSLFCFDGFTQYENIGPP